MSTRSRQGGYSLLELVVVGMVVAVLLGLAVSNWHGHAERQRLRYGVAQVASDLRVAVERAKAERIAYTVTFNADSGDYTIARSGGGFLENARLPDRVTAERNLIVTVSAFGRPDAAYTVTVRNGSGTAAASINAAGGISYQEP